MGLLQPEYSASVFDYTATLSYDASQIRLRPFYRGEGSVVINGETLDSLEPTAPIFLEEGANQIEVITQPTDGTPSMTYSITLNRQSFEAFTQSAYIKASNTGTDSFGFSSAMDGNTLVVGAPNEDSSDSGVDANQSDNGALDSGAVYVFVYENGEWRQQAYIKASNTDAGDQFGRSVAISGDTLVVGAEGEDSAAIGINGDESDNSSESAGAAYVFERVGTVWQQTAYLKANQTIEEGVFGSDVDIDGQTIVVGAQGDSNSARGINSEEINQDVMRSGAAYVFTKVNESWQQEAFIKSSNSDQYDWFGNDVAISANTIAVSAYSEESDATGVNGNQDSNEFAISGAVYIFDRNGTEWTQSAYIKSSNNYGSYLFGESMDLDGDILVASSPNESRGSTGINGDQSSRSGYVNRSGAIYVYVREQGIWSHQAYIKASNADEQDDFGLTGLAIRGDRILASAISEKSRASGVNQGADANYINDHIEQGWGPFQPRDGASYLFERNNGEWQEIAYLKASDTQEFMAFGSSAALSDEFIVIGARDEHSPSSGVNPSQDNFEFMDSAGAIYVFPANLQ